MRELSTAVWHEGLRWLRGLTASAGRHPGYAVVLLAVTWLAIPVLPRGFLLTAPALATTCLFWAATHPLSFHQLVTGPAVRGWRRSWFRRHWPELAGACGLGRERRRRGRADRENRLEVDVPGLGRIRTDGPRVMLRVRPLMGQTVEDFEAAAERMRTAVGSTRLRVEPYGTNEVLLTFTIGDVLAEPFTASQPSSETPTSLTHVSMGRREDGSNWHLPIGPHTLVAGCSGAGKGSVFWTFAFGLAPAVKAGLVRLHGIDLKGGMEVLMGGDLFSTRATTSSEAVVVLESLVEQMQRRTSAYAGRVRSHEPTTDEPLHVVMIDELAALTAYCPQRDLQRRAEMAINLLCSQGRAPGFVVFACLQDPRKEVIPSRGLFTQMIGLRLKDVSETTMVLGETAVTSGAHCHRIPRSVPGTGYVIPEEGGYPIRVRAGFASDHAIRQVAKTFPTPFQESVPALEVRDDLLPRPRQSRSKGAA
jgi:S-DNA-T family DNA segregation ATPase FtsK/SpoIIIE